MENEDKGTSRARYIRLSVTECIGEKDYCFPEKEMKTIPRRNYKKGVQEILQSSFSVNEKKMNIFKITLTGTPTPLEIDEIFDWFRAEPVVYFSVQEILVKTSSENFSKIARTLVRKARESVKTFVEEVRLLTPEEKMASVLYDVIFQKNHPDKMDLIVFLVPGFSVREVQGLQRQISSLIHESSRLELIDLDNGIFLSSITAEDAQTLVTKPYILQISEDHGLQPLEGNE